jgi:lysophospholipase L1-like esterase
MKRVLWALAASAAALVCAVWCDWLPGGWRVRALLADPRATAERADREQRARRLAQFAGESVPSGAVVFLGSSTIERFDLEASFPGRRAINRGIGNEPLAGLEERWRAAVPSHAAGVVLYAGSVDFRRRAISSDEFERRVERLLADLVRERPGVALLVLGLLPERDLDARSARELDAWNQCLHAAAERHGACFVSTDRAPLRTAGRGLAEAFSSDRLHLDSEGYEVLRAWILDADSPVAAALDP